MILLVTVSFLAFLLFLIHWLTGSDPAVSHYPREDSEFYGLEAAPCALINPEKQIVINDADFYSENDALLFYQYTDSYYDADMLMAEADYDPEGRLSNLHLLEYDMAGNLYQEHMESETDGNQTRRYVYEYDDSGNVVHEEVYWDGNLAERNYFRYTDIGRAGISYSYVDEQYEGGLSSYSLSRREFLEDEQGNLLCVFEVPAEIPSDVWRMQWTQRDGYLVNRLRYYERNSWGSYNGGSYSDSDWYLGRETANEEYFNLYVCDPDTGEKNCTLQIIYDWDNETDTFVLLPSFYLAQYDEDRLLWQLDYEDDRVQYYNVRQYDKDGRLQAAVEYVGNGDEPYALFHRYEYSAEEEKVNYYYGERLDINDIPQAAGRREAHYFYEIAGQEFSHQAEDGSNIMLVFSDEGFLSKAEMTDASENTLQQCEVVISGKDFGKLGKLYIGGYMAEGMDAIMEELEEQARFYGFRVGEDLEGGAE